MLGGYVLEVRHELLQLTVQVVCSLQVVKPLAALRLAFKLDNRDEPAPLNAFQKSPSAIVGNWDPCFPPLTTTTPGVF